MVASGFAGLGYQIVWTKQSALWLGHDAPAVLAVIAAFFAGLGLGSLLFSGRIERSSFPQRWFASCEAVIGLWSITLAVLMPHATSVLIDIVGPRPSAAWQWFVTFGGTFLLLAPATLAMGATMPAMERVLGSLHHHGERIGTLYAGNTFGALLGVLLCAFWWVPTFGLVATAIGCAVLNFACAALATLLPSSPARAAFLMNGKPSLVPLALTGVLGIGYEVVVVRVLSQVAENSIYTYAILIATYLMGTALGAAAYARYSKAFSSLWNRTQLAVALTGTCVASIVALAYSLEIKSAWLNMWPTSFAAAISGEVVLAVLAFLPPTMVMGALFSDLMASVRAAGVSFGRALGVNTLSAAMAPVLFGVLLIPLTGAKVTLLLIALSYLLLVNRSAWRTSTPWVSAAAALAAFVAIGPLVVVSVPEGGRLIRYIEGTSASVSVVEDARGTATLHIDNRQQEGSTATLFADARQAAVPLLLHPRPANALFLGVGTGVTALSAAMDSTLDVHAVELLPEVLSASSHFRPVLDLAEQPGNLTLVAADARRFVRSTDDRYDVIVADNFHPARSGSGTLYTVEHFHSVGARLAPGGLFCQWLPLHQMDLETLRTIVATFTSVFPQSFAVLATHSLETPVVGLVARAAGAAFEWREVSARLASSATADREPTLGFTNELAVLGVFIAGPDALTVFSRGAVLNTDDLPVVSYRAPRLTYAADSTPRDRLIMLLEEVWVSPAEVVASVDAATSSRLRDYWAARNMFIEAGRDVKPTSDVRAMLAQVREPLLLTLRKSPDFQPAYDPLLAMARALIEVDPDAARVLLAELTSIQPSRSEARELLHQLPGR